MGDTARDPPDSGMLRSYTPEEDRASTTIDEAARTVEVVASTEAIDSYGTKFLADGWDLKRFGKNPILLSCHNARDTKMILGTADVRIAGKRLEATMRFLPLGTEEEADRVFNLYRLKVLRGVSVGFNPLDWSDEEEDDKLAGRKRMIRTFKRQELVELSAAPVPSNPDALAREMREFGVGLETRGVVPFKASPPSASKTWDAAAAKKRVKAWAGDSVEKLRSAFAAFDSDKPENESSFHLPHHDIEGGHMVTSRAGVIAAGNAIQGSRGGVKLSDADKAGAKSHLAKHYKQFDMTPPWESKEKSFTAAAAESRAKGRTMDQENTPVVLPPEIAALLGVATVDEAVTELQTRALKLDELTVQLDAATKAADAKVAEATAKATAAETRAAEAEKRLTERNDAEATAYVERLIKLDLLSEKVKDHALRMAKASMTDFVATHPLPAAAEAPMSHLLRQIVPAERPQQATPPLQDGAGELENGANPIVAEKIRLMAEAKAADKQLSEYDAWSTAYANVAKKLAKKSANKPAAHQV